MFGGLEAAVPMLDLPSIGGALGVLSVGVWLLRLQRVAAAIRLAGLLLVLLGLVLVAGAGTDVLAVDVSAFRALLDAGAGAFIDVIRVLGFAGGRA